MVVEEVSGIAGDLSNLKKFKAFMGISIRNPFFSKRNMREYFQWASRTFEEFVILLMDEPDRHNLMVFKAISEKDALEKIIRDLNIANIKILQFQDFHNDKLYSSLLSQFNQIVNQNDEIKAEIFYVMNKNIGSRFELFISENHINENTKNEMLLELSEYIIEEIVSLLYFTEIGYTIEIDPTKELIVKKKIYSGEYKNVMTDLGLTKKGSHIFAHPEGEQY